MQSPEKEKKGKHGMSDSKKWHQTGQTLPLVQKFQLAKCEELLQKNVYDAVTTHNRKLRRQMVTKGYTRDKLKSTSG